MKTGTHKHTAPKCTYNKNILTNTHTHTHKHTGLEGRAKPTQSDHRSEEMGSDVGGAQPLRQRGGNSSLAERKDCVTTEIMNWEG